MSCLRERWGTLRGTGEGVVARVSSSGLSFWSGGALDVAAEY